MGNSAKTSILIADDEPMIRYLIRDIRRDLTCRLRLSMKRLMVQNAWNLLRSINQRL